MEKFNELAHGQNVWETGHGFPTMTLLCIAKMMQNSHTFKWVIKIAHMMFLLLYNREVLM